MILSGEKLRHGQSLEKREKKFFTPRESTVTLFRRLKKSELQQYAMSTTTDLHHSILREFPEYRETVKLLKAGDVNFRKMFDEYHTLDEAIYRIEEEIDFATDQEIEELKKRRAWLKDRIYQAIRRPAPLNPLQRPQPQGPVAAP